ncbi:ABC transporter ATP-binding protein [Salipiger sp.]|uniref:ABC transporter ATP-binding protein n=1 Tax=Salipiger sp. TaxID=2078585 RepID=UPI003A97248C
MKLARQHPPDAAGQPLVEIRDLTVSFAGIPVVRHLDLAIRPDEAVGIVGESGSGKSVTWLAALGLLAGAKVQGQVLLQGDDLVGASEDRLASVRGGRIGLIFQDPVSSLNPVKRVGAQVIEALRLHRGLRDEAARAEARNLFELVGIPDAARRLDRYPHELSGGQNQRVMIAMALAGQPELLVADEPTTALDVTIQAQILSLIERLRHEMNMGLVLISHDLSVVADVCDRIVVMYAGTVMEIAPAATLFNAPAHPYSRGLLAAAPTLTGRRQRLAAIRGQVPEPWNMPPGCAFAPRCPFAIAACDQVRPALVETAPGQQAACIRADELPPWSGTSGAGNEQTGGSDDPA